MPAPLRLVFLGSDPIALPLLDGLAGKVFGPEGQGGISVEIVGVFTQPDRAVGRGQQVQPNAIKTWALARSIPVWQPEKITDDVRARLAELAADLALVMAYGHILKDDFIATPRLGTFNLHTSLLPKYRGASPIQTAIAQGERETGVALMRMVRRLDAGPVADVERVAIGPLDTAAAVEAKLAAACVPLLARALPRLVAGTLALLPQDDRAATYCRKLGKEDGTIDFQQAASSIAARINGLFPWPSCRIELNGQPVKLGLADALVPSSEPGLLHESSGGPGRVLGADAAGLLISTAEGVLRLRELQRPGGRLLPAPEFLRGFAVAAGTQISSRPMPVLVTTRS